MPEPYLVFISHSARDTWVAIKLAEEAAQAGASTFLDEAQIEAGDDFDAVLRRNLNLADELLVLVTPWSLKRPYIWMEVGVAWGRDIRIVALLQGLTPGEMQTHPDVPVTLKTRDLIELNDASTYFEQLRRRAIAERGEQ